MPADPADHRGEALRDRRLGRPALGRRRQDVGPPVLRMAHTLELTLPHQTLDHRGQRCRREAEIPAELGRRGIAVDVHPARQRELGRRDARAFDHLLDQQTAELREDERLQQETRLDSSTRSHHITTIWYYIWRRSPSRPYKSAASTSRAASPLHRARYT